MVGSVFGGLTALVTELFTIVARVTGGIASGFTSMMGIIRPAFDAVRLALSKLGDAWQMLTGRADESAAATDASTRAWRTLGSVLGKVVGGAVSAITFALSGLIQVLTAVVYGVGMVKDAFVSAGTLIGETAAKVYLWFSETLPGAISSAVGKVVGFFGTMRQYLAGVGRWLSKLFGSIAGGIRGFLQPVVDFFSRVARSIRRVFSGLRDFVIRLLRRIPDSLLPASLERLSRQPLSVEVRSAGGFEAVGPTRANTVPASAVATMPARAEASGRHSDLAQFEANVLAFANAQARAQGQAQPFEVNVQVDGETVARAVHNANTDAAARSFSPVPVY